MDELTLLKLLLAVAFVLAPLMTNAFFLNDSKMYSIAHYASLFLIFTGALLRLKAAAFVWPLFCTFGFFLYLKGQSKLRFSINDSAQLIPFVFSLISATWLVAGVNDWHLLGYNMAWSFYAALHGAFLGWIFIGCLAFLSRRKKTKSFWAYGCYLAFVCFLLIAFGIDGIPYIKPVGVVGLSVLVPALIGVYTFGLEKVNRSSVYFSSLSFGAIAISMSLALLNEFWPSLPRFAWGRPTMVLGHGILNAIVTIPAFYLAIKIEKKSD